ncbi:MAG: cell division protein SepF [Synergistaceae bacterium]|nr:cell division protein SepF [Synergistaceae bacterium]
MNLMKFFGFETDEDDYDENDDYSEERRRKSPSRKERSSKSSSGSSNGKLIIYNGVASDADKRKLREAFNNGAIILVDLHELNQREYDEEGKEFITFMGGLAYAHEGEGRFIEPSQYLFTPGVGMYEIWPEEESRE